MAFDLDPARIDAAEGLLGVRLPPEYRARMARLNGGEVHVAGEVWHLHPIFDDGDVRRLKRSASDLVHETREARAWPGFPHDAISIAADGSGNHLILIPAQPGAAVLGGSVLRWDHETGELERVADALDQVEGSVP